MISAHFDGRRFFKNRHCTPLIYHCAWQMRDTFYIPSELDLSLLPSPPSLFPAGILLKEHPDIFLGQFIFPALFPGGLQL